MSVVVDVGLGHPGGLARAAAGHHEHVVEHPREQRDALDHEVEADDRPHLGQRHVPVRAPPAGAVHARRLVHARRAARAAGRGRGSRRSPSSFQTITPTSDEQRVVGVAQPVLGQAARGRSSRSDELSSAVQRQDLAEQHADDRDRQQVGDEHDDRGGSASRACPRTAGSQISSAIAMMSGRRRASSRRLWPTALRKSGSSNDDVQVVETDRTRRRGAAPPRPGGRCRSRRRTRSTASAGATQSSASSDRNRRRERRACAAPPSGVPPE